MCIGRMVIKHLISIVLLFIGALSQLLAQAPMAYLSTAQEVSYHSSATFANHNSVAIHTKGNRLLVPGKVNGVQGYFLLDTGSPALVVHTELAKDKGQVLNGCAADGKAVILHEVVLDELVYRNQTYANVKALSLDFSHLKVWKEESFLGLLGKEWLEQQPFVLDLKHNRVLYFSEREKTVWQGRRPAVVSPITWIDHIPVIQLFIQGEAYWFGIDSGSSDNIISQPTLSRLPAESIGDLGYSRLQTLHDDSQQAKFVSVDSVQLSPRQGLKSVSFVIADLSHIQLPSGEKLDGLIGASFLQGNILSIDYHDDAVKWWFLE